MPEPMHPPVVVSTRRLLHLIQSCDQLNDQTLRNAALSLRSWLAHKLHEPVTQLPDELVGRYNLISTYTLEKAHEKTKTVSR